MAVVKHREEEKEMPKGKIFPKIPSHIMASWKQDVMELSKIFGEIKSFLFLKICKVQSQHLIKQCKDKVSL